MNECEPVTKIGVLGGPTPFLTYFKAKIETKVK
jgi:hypothetical protein